MTTEKKSRPRVFVSLDQLTFDVLQETADTSGLALSLIVNQLIRAHVQELREFNDWIKRQEGDALIREVQAMDSHSPNAPLSELRALLIERRARKHTR